MFPSHPLFRRFENEIVIDDQVFEWMTRGHDFFFRPVGGDLRVIWCELYRGEMAAAMKDPVRLERVQRRIAKNIALKRLWRFWPLSDERELAFSPDSVLMRHRNADFWLRLEWQEAVSADELFVADLSPILSRLEPSDDGWILLETIRSEGALPWFQCSRGNMEELKRVLWACLAIYGGSFYISKGTDLLFRWLLHAPYAAREEGWESYNRIRNVLDARFILRWHPLSSRTCKPQGKPVKRPIVSVRPSPSISEHERLEAQLVWRDFLSGKLAEEEIARLLHV